VECAIDVASVKTTFLAAAPSRRPCFRRVGVVTVRSTRSPKTIYPTTLCGLIVKLTVSRVTMYDVMTCRSY